MEFHEKATAALSWLTTGERKSDDTGRQITVRHDDAPEWMTDLCREAHDDGDGSGPMLPDDFRYEFISDALYYLADEDNDPDDYNPEPSIYSAELCRWLSSHGWRPGYCDSAAAELGDGGDTIARLSRGQWYEMRLVYDSIRRSLEALDDDEVTTREQEASS